MSMIQASTSSNVTRTSGMSGWMKRHPLVAYFVLAYALTWVLIVPIMLSQRGLGIFNLPDPLLLALFLLSTFSGPLPTATLAADVPVASGARLVSVGHCWISTDFPVRLDLLLGRGSLDRADPKMALDFHFLSSDSRHWNHLSRPRRGTWVAWLCPAAPAIAIRTIIRKPDPWCVSWAVAFACLFHSRDDSRWSLQFHRIRSQYVFDHRHNFYLDLALQSCRPEYPVCNVRACGEQCSQWLDSAPDR